MVGHELADGNIGLVVDWGGNDADHETARSIPAHLVPASPGDHSYLGRLSSTPTSHDPTYPVGIPSIHLCPLALGTAGEQQGGRVARNGKFVIKQGRVARPTSCSSPAMVASW